MTKAAIVFIAMFALDFVWARYTFAMTQKRAGAAATYSAVIIGLGGASTINYVSDHWMLIPAAAGAFAGTWLAVERQRNGHG